MANNASEATLSSTPPALDSTSKLNLLFGLLIRSHSNRRP